MQCSINAVIFPPLTFTNQFYESSQAPDRSTNQGLISLPYALSFIIGKGDNKTV